MALHRNIFAFTAPGCEYPEFVSINETDGRVEISVRAPKKPPGEYPFVMPGDGVTMPLPVEQLPALIAALTEYHASYVEGARKF